MRSDKRPALSNTAAIASRHCRSDPTAVTEMGRNWWKGEQTAEQAATQPRRGVGMGRVDAGCESPRGVKEELC